MSVESGRVDLRKSILYDRFGIADLKKDKEKDKAEG